MLCPKSSLSCFCRQKTFLAADATSFLTCRQGLAAVNTQNFRPNTLFGVGGGGNFFPGSQFFSTQGSFRCAGENENLPSVLFGGRWVYCADIFDTLPFLKNKNIQRSKGSKLSIRFEGFLSKRPPTFLCS